MLSARARKVEYTHYLEGVLKTLVDENKQLELKVDELLDMLQFGKNRIERLQEELRIIKDSK